MSTPLHDPTWRGFASDNYAGVHPEVLQALATSKATPEELVEIKRLIDKKRGSQ